MDTVENVTDDLGGSTGGGGLGGFRFESERVRDKRMFGRERVRERGEGTWGVM